MANTEQLNRFNNSIDVIPDAQVKHLAYGDQIYSTTKLSGILAQLADRSGDTAAVKYQIEAEKESLFPIAAEWFDDVQNSLIIYNPPRTDINTRTFAQSLRSENEVQYNYIFTKGTETTKAYAQLGQLISFNVDDDKVYLNFPLHGIHNAAAFDITTGKLKYLSLSGTIKVKVDNIPQSNLQLLRAPISESEDISSIDIQAALENDIENALVADSKNYRYNEVARYFPLSIAEVGYDIYSELVKDEKVNPDILYQVSCDHLDAFGKQITNVADPINQTDAVNKQWVIDYVQNAGQDPVKTLVNIAYSDLRQLVENRQLVPGQQYRITDYEATLNESYSNKFVVLNNVQFDIIVTADSEYQLTENARAAFHDNDSFGAVPSQNYKPWKWQLKYTIFNDSYEYAWADETNGKGVVYWLKDEFNNEAFFDFKNILPFIGSNSKLAIGNECRNCIIKDSANGSTYDIKQVAICDNCMNVCIGSDSDDILVDSYCKNIDIGSNTTNVKVKEYCQSIKIGNNVVDVVIPENSSKIYIDNV